MKATKKNGGNGLTEEQFVKQAITNLRTGGYKGIHTRFSGFNDAFRKHFGTDPVAATKNLAEKGIIDIRPCKGGAMIYLHGEMPAMQAKGDTALAKILAN